MVVDRRKTGGEKNGIFPSRSVHLLSSTASITFTWNKRSVFSSRRVVSLERTFVVKQISLYTLVFMIYITFSFQKSITLFDLIMSDIKKGKL